MSAGTLRLLVTGVAVSALVRRDGVVEHVKERAIEIVVCVRAAEACGLETELNSSRADWDMQASADQFPSCRRVLCHRNDLAADGRAAAIEERHGDLTAIHRGLVERT